MSHFFLVPSLLLMLSGAIGYAAEAADAAHATAAPDAHAGHAHGAAGIALTATVRDNLGITFAKAEYRVVQGLLRAPGHFEAEPGAQRAYQMPLGGRVEVLVRPYQRVSAGEPLYRITSTAWQILQRELAEAHATAGLAGDRRNGAQAHLEAVVQAATLWRERAKNLERLASEVGGKAAELAEANSRAADFLIQQTEARNRLAELTLQAQGADGTAASGLAAIRLHHLLLTAAAITGVDRTLLSTPTSESDNRPRWQTLDEPVMVAVTPGVVEGEVATNGTWLDAHATVLTVTDPTNVRLRATTLQSDLRKLRDGLPARIVGADPEDPLRLEVSVVLAPLADARDRSVELIARPLAGQTVPAGIRPGIAAILEVAVAGSADEELAIPLVATIRDGLNKVFFKRNRATPDVVEKVVADLGANDGRWVVVNSGLKEGDEVVLGGIYPLKLSQQSGGGAAAAGHFEADGTFHTGTH